VLVDHGFRLPSAGQSPLRLVNSER
jgi:hypothetical protein